MPGRPTNTNQTGKQTKRWQSYSVGWVATFVAVLLVIILIVATVDGLNIALRKRAFRETEAELPIRSQVYPESIPAPPTVVAIPPSARDKVSPAEVSPPVAVVAHQETTQVLRSGPGAEYAALRKLAPNEPVQLVTAPIDIRGQQWRMVRTGDGQVGWCLIDWLVPASTGE